MVKRKGWRNEPLRHSLASKGVKTGRKAYIKKTNRGTYQIRSSDNKLLKGNIKDYKDAQAGLTIAQETELNSTPLTKKERNVLNKLNINEINRYGTVYYELQRGKQPDTNMTELQFVQTTLNLNRKEAMQLVGRYLGLLEDGKIKR